MYDRSKSVYNQSPTWFSLKKIGGQYSIAKGSVVKTTLEKLSFAISTFDRLSGSNNPNGIYSARLFKDGQVISQFVLDNIDYSETRYMNAHIDYRMKMSGGASAQHLGRMPGDTSEVYTENGIIYLDDTLQHKILIEVADHNSNISTLEFFIKKVEGENKNHESVPMQKLLPRQVNVFETSDFELFTSEYSVYDTVNVSYTSGNLPLANAISNRHNFSSYLIPSHDSIIIRLKPFVQLSGDQKERVVIQCVSGNRKIVQKARWNNGWAWAKFRNFGSFQAFIDTTPAVINSLGSGDTVNLSRAGRIVFTPRDNFNVIRSFRAELDGKWIMFSNDKGRSWVYYFDEHFPAGVHELKITVEDVAGNKTTASWWCKR